MKVLHTKLKNKQSVAGFLFALPSLAGFALFFAIPFVISLFYCFTQGIGGVDFVGFQNFIDLFHSNSFILASWNTIIFNTISVPLIIVLSFFLSILLNSRIKGLPVFRSFFILPLVIPVASVILVWNILFNEYGVINSILMTFGFAGNLDWIRSDQSMWVLVLLYLWKNCGYNVILFLAGINNIPKEYYESAKMDGAGAFACLKNITVPFMIPTGFFVFMMSIVNSFKVFREAYLLAGSYPSLKIYMLQHFMNNNFMNLSYQRLTTAAFIMAIVIALLVFVLFRIEARFGRSI
jgi:multiple sugar transport system permease protein